VEVGSSSNAILFIYLFVGCAADFESLADTWKFF
jgi:hypothetical protein